MITAVPQHGVDKLMKLVHSENGKIVNIPKRARLREMILLELTKEGYLSTKELEDRLAIKSCYATCKSLEGMSILESSLDSKYTLWDPVTGQVITKDNYDLITSRSQEAREKLTKQLKSEGLSEEEIAEKLRNLIDPRSLEVHFRTWWLSDKWKVLQG